MAGESIVNVTEGSGKKLHTYQRTIGANAVEDEVVIPGEHYLATYIVTPAAAVSSAAADDMVQIMAGASLNVRIRRILFQQSGLATTAGGASFTVIRLTSAGTGGTAITPSKFDNGDAASGATCASGVPAATHGTAGVTLLQRRIYTIQTASTAATSPTPFFEWVANPGTKPIIIPAGATNGIAIRNVSAVAGATWFFEIEFTETSFL